MPGVGGGGGGGGPTGVPKYNVKIALDRSEGLFLAADPHFGSNNVWGDRFNTDAVYVSEPIFADDSDRTRKGVWKWLFVKFNMGFPRPTRIKVYAKRGHFPEFPLRDPDFELTFIPLDGENSIELKDANGLHLMSESIQIEIRIPHAVWSPLYLLYSSGGFNRIEHYYVLRNAIADLWVEYDEVGDKYNIEF